MSLLARLLLCCFGLVLAIPAGAAALVVALVADPALNVWLATGASALLDAALSDFGGGLSPETILLLFAGLAQAAFALLVVPPVLVAAIGETLRVRALAWYGGGCGLLTALLPWLVRGAVRPRADQIAAEGRVTALLFVAGAVAGLVYWFVAGRHGAAREPARRP